MRVVGLWLYCTGKKTPGSRDTHGTHTGHAGAQGHTDHTDEPHNHPNSPTHTRTSAQRPKPRPTQQPQARSRPLPAADSEEAAPSVEPYPASTRSHSAPPRACSKAVGEMTFEMKAHIPVTPPRSTRREMLHRTHFHNTPHANAKRTAEPRIHVHCLIQASKVWAYICFFSALSFSYTRDTAGYRSAVLGCACLVTCVV